MVKIIKNIFKKNIQFVKYSIIGCIGVFIDLIVFVSLSKLFDKVILVNIISVSLGISTNFFLNRNFNFKTKDNLTIRYFRFFATGLLGMFISTVIIYIFVVLLSLNEIIAKFIAIVIVGIIQFTINSNWSFKK